MVRLITHNLLACHVKNCTSNNFPLLLKDVQVEMREAEYNPDFLRGFMPKIEWTALVDAAKQVLSTHISGNRCYVTNTMRIWFALKSWVTHHCLLSSRRSLTTSF